MKKYRASWLQDRRTRVLGIHWFNSELHLAFSRLLARRAKERVRGRKRGGTGGEKKSPLIFVPSPSPLRVSLGAWNGLSAILSQNQDLCLGSKQGTALGSSLDICLGFKQRAALGSSLHAKNFMAPGLQS